MQRIKTVSLIEDNGGVMVAPIPITPGSDVTVVYNGLLAQSGADSVSLHCGYGPNWQQVGDLQLFKTSRGWENTFKISETDRLSFCFKDSADNWDNNNGHNWTYDINHY